MLARRNLSWELEGFACDITVATASTGMGLYRSELVEEGLQSREKNPMKKAFLWLQWPVIKAGTVSGDMAWTEEAGPQGEAAEGESAEPEQAWVRSDFDSITPETFLEQVPESVASEWLLAILELNPHWTLRTSAELEEEASDPAKKKKS